MKQKWQLKHLENKVVGISVEEEKKIIEEIAELAYKYLSQLPKDAVLNLSNEEDNFLQRTGTDA